jgi:hypothetical protein
MAREAIGHGREQSGVGQKLTALNAGMISAQYGFAPAGPEFQAMNENTVVGIIVGSAFAGILLLFVLFSGPNRADRPAASADRPAQTTGGGTAPAR